MQTRHALKMQFVTLTTSVRCWAMADTFSSSERSRDSVAWEIKLTASSDTSLRPSFLAADEGKPNRQVRKRIHLFLSFSSPLIAVVLSPWPCGRPRTRFDDAAVQQAGGQEGLILA